jgi:hypothetical protein
MKRHVFSVLTLFGLCIILFLSCRKTSTTPTQTTHVNPYGGTNGKESFYIESDLGHGNISVYVDGTYQGTISHYHSSGITCGSADVNVTLTAGAHSFSATATGYSWSNTFTVAQEVCSSIKLTN